MERTPRVTCFRDFVELAEKTGGSDFFLSERLPVFSLIERQLKPISRPLTRRDLETVLTEAFGHQGVFAPLARGEECDFTAFDLASGVRFRVNVALSTGRPFAVFRRLLPINRTPDELGVPEGFTRLPFSYGYGLILVVGVTGSGKSTTLASLLAHLLEHRSKVAITVEDPIEYIIPPGKGLVFQREVGRDTRSFATGLRAAMREKPDIILVGEIRDRETAMAAITAAETGHLVFATLHTKDVSLVSSRICGMFEDPRETKLRLAEVLVGVLAQTLVRGKGGVHLATELLEMDGTMRELLLKDDRTGIRRILAEKGLRMADSLVSLVQRGLVEEQRALQACNDIEEIKAALKALKEDNDLEVS